MAAQKVSVITWRYLDGSDSGLVGAFSDSVAALLLEVLRKHGDAMKEFSLDVVSVDALAQEPA